MPSSAEDTLLARLVRRAAEDPLSIALRSSGRVLTCADLMREGNAWARCLIACGVTQGSQVGLYMKRGAQYLGVIVGAMVARATYVPVGAGVSKARLSTLMRDAAIVVTDDPDLRALPECRGRVIHLEDRERACEGQGEGDAERLSSPGAQDYAISILYTSGTTGRPKGVTLTARAVADQVFEMVARYPFVAGDTALLHRSSAIIGWHWDFWGPLISGVPIVVLDEADAQDPHALLRHIADHRISHFAAAPTLLASIARVAETGGKDLGSLRLVVTGGEALPAGLAAQWARLAPQSTLVDVYAATECLYVSRAEPRRSSTSVSVGLPCAGVDVYVLDGQLRSVPHGVVGDIYVTGRRLAWGYAKDSGRTAERWVPSPEGEGQRMFRTGDLGMIHPDGTLAIGGRRDNQVKVHGFRVELEEVDAAMRHALQTSAAVSVARPDGRGRTQLIAFFVDGVGVADPRRARARMLSDYPHYLVPTRFLAVPDLPLTERGKIDRAALAHTSLPTAAMVPQALSGIEASMAAQWRALLECDIDLEDDFFELGGDSVAALDLVADIKARYGVEMHFVELLQHRTLAAVSAAVAARRHAVVPHYSSATS